MCDVRDYAVRLVLTTCITPLEPSMMPNSTSPPLKIELLIVIFVLEKFRSCLSCTKVTLFFDHIGLRYLLTKKDAKPILVRWILLLQEFD